MPRHPDHDELTVEVARWYREPTPEMGYDLVEGRFGWFNRPTSTGRGRGTIRPGVAAEDVDALVAEAQDVITLDALELTFDDRATAAALAPALEARGFQPGTATVFLAYTSDFDHFPADGPGALSIAAVPSDGEKLTVWAKVKLQAFADSEATPAHTDLERELVVRRAKMAGQARALSAAVGNEMVGICGYYEDADRFVFLLGTRVPFRRRGIGRALLGHVVRGAAERSCRSVLINGDEDGRPVALYRQLGFNDEVHWRQSWTRPTR